MASTFKTGLSCMPISINSQKCLLTEWSRLKIMIGKGGLFQLKMWKAFPSTFWNGIGTHWWMNYNQEKTFQIKTTKRIKADCTLIIFVFYMGNKGLEPPSYPTPIAKFCLYYLLFISFHFFVQKKLIAYFDQCEQHPNTSQNIQH